MKLFSVIAGFLIGYFIVKLCFSNIIIRGPDSNEIKKHIYVDETTKECYQLIPNVCICPIGTS